MSRLPSSYYILHNKFSIPLQQPDVRLKFLIYSRAEPHLTLEFTSLTSPGMATRLSQDAGYERNADIEQYLTHSFHQIAHYNRISLLHGLPMMLFSPSESLVNHPVNSFSQLAQLSSAYLLSSQVQTRILEEALRLQERRVWWRERT